MFIFPLLSDVIINRYLPKFTQVRISALSTSRQCDFYKGLTLKVGVGRRKVTTYFNNLRKKFNFRLPQRK